MWHGSVTFEEQSATSIITYAVSSTIKQQQTDLMIKISNVLTNFCTAAAMVQWNGLCCNSFTFLLHLQDHLELKRIELQYAEHMAFSIDLALRGDNVVAAPLQNYVQWAGKILQELGLTVSEVKSNDHVHYCALATQFLCVAFLSYTHAHIGSIDPFFLDTPQRKMILLGSQQISEKAVINAELVDLICLAKMTQQLVLVFSSPLTGWKLQSKRSISQYDVLATAIDCLDTWGPGYFAYSTANPSNVHGFTIGGRFVSLLNRETLHLH